MSGLQDQVPGLLRGQLSNIIAGGIFLFIGLASWCIAAIRRQTGVRLLIWIGLWSGMYGVELLLGSRAVVAALPERIRVIVPSINTGIAYLGVLVTLLAFRELSLRSFRRFIEILILVATIVALAGIGRSLFGATDDKLMPYNHLIAVCALLVLIIVITVKKLSMRFMVLINRRVLGFGTLVFALTALWGNLSGSLHYRLPYFVGNLAFAVFLFSFAYVAAEMTVANERRLLSIENELEVARQLQLSILPTSIPEVGNLRIAVAYRPMANVAGDFYEFIPVDPKRAGFLVADVTGHGVPAALIASMIKVAAQSIVACADDPREVLRGLNRILSPQLRNQLVSAAYLWLDTENHLASYSAAGHPPLLLWRNGSMERIESNGLLFGVIADPDYPVCAMRVASGDRFLLCTDGVIEPENQHGNCFGDRKLEQIIREHESHSPSELSDQILSEIDLWQSTSQSQQDDITLIVIDVL